MRPIAIFRFSQTEGPAYFAEWLDAQSLPWQLIAVDEGHAIPSDLRAFSGIGMMGGPMSANDALAWIDPLSRLLRDAVAQQLPVIGHCLGGQLLAQALGARVQRTEVPEIGWIDVEATDAVAQQRVVRRPGAVHAVPMALRRVRPAERRNARAHQSIQREPGLRRSMTGTSASNAISR